MTPLTVDSASTTGLANPDRTPLTPVVSMPLIERVVIVPARIEYSPAALVLARLLARASRSGAARLLIRLILVTLVAGLLGACLYL